MPGYHFFEGGVELLDAIGPLWKKLTLHHSGISIHFSDQFAAGEFPERKQDLQEKAAAGKLRTVLASAGNNGPCIGYCVAVIDAKAHGEIESLYVEDACRNRGVGSGLVERILIEWNCPIKHYIASWQMPNYIFPAPPSHTF